MRKGLHVATGLAILLAAGTACGGQTSADDLAKILERQVNSATPAAQSTPADQWATDSSADASAAATSPDAVDPSAAGSSSSGSSDVSSGAFGATPSGSAGAPGKSSTAAGSPAAGQPKSRQAASSGSTAGGGPAASGANAASPAPATPGAPAPGGPAPAGAAACNGAPLTIGSVGQLSGILGEVFGPVMRGAQAWAAEMNSRGGVNCHKITYLTADDGADPARHQAQVRQMVEKDKVVAFVPMIAPITARASKDYLNEKKVPVIGSEGGEMIFYESLMHFAPSAVDDVIFETTAVIGAKATIPEGKKKAATLTCQEIEACNAAEAAFKKMGPKVGYEMVYNGKASLANPDFTSYCLEARNAGADVVLGGTDASTYRRLKRDCAKLGYNPTVVLTSIQSADVFIDDPLMEGSVIMQPVLPWVIDKPGPQEFMAAVRKHVPKPTSLPGMQIGWVAAKAFEAAVSAKIGPADTPSPALVLAGLYTFTNNDLGGITVPLTFRPGQEEKKQYCGWMVKVGKGKWLPQGEAPICVGQN